MSKVNFFTPVSYKNTPKSISTYCLEKVDNYFYLGGKKAYVIQERTNDNKAQVVFSPSKSSRIAKSAKVISYFTIVAPAFMLGVKVILRSTHSFRHFDTKAELGKGIDVPEEAVEKLKEIMPLIFDGQESEDIQWLSKKNNYIFKLKDYPEFVFKIGKQGHSGDRFKKMIQSKEVCMAHQFDRLIVPHAKQLTVNKDYIFIVEEYLELNPNESDQEELYYKHAKNLDKAVIQLANFIAKTKFNDVTPRNISILEEGLIVLNDLEHMESAKNGFVGDVNGSCGLIGCVSEDQVDIVIAEARRQGVRIPKKELQWAKERRLQALESYVQLMAYYEVNGIQGKELLEVDMDSLDLDFNKEGEIDAMVVKDGDLHYLKKTVTLRDVAEHIVGQINTLIQKNSDQSSIKGMRYVRLSSHKHPFMEYERLGEKEGQLWVDQVISALADQGHIFKLDRRDGNGWYIQA